MADAHTEQYDRARTMLTACWPHKWPHDDNTLMIVAELMAAFARMEIRRAVKELAQ